jgi:MFS family permease
VAQIGGAGLVSWSVSIYEIASVVAGAASALLTMRYGLRAPMSAAALLFGLGCLISAVAPSMPVVLTGRVLQGFGGGGLTSMAFVAVSVLFPRRYAARALAVVSTFWGISAFLGPLIGGFFVEFATWRWGFGFFAVQAFGLAFWVGLRGDQSPGQVAAAETRFPFKRLGLLCLAVLLVSYGGVKIDLVQTTAFVVLGLACLIYFLRLDNRAEQDRLLPINPFDFRKPTGAALLMVLTLAIGTIAITAFGPLLVTAIHGASALTAGYIVACSSIGWSTAAVVFSGSPERLDRVMIAMGISVVVASVFGFLYAVPNGPIWLIAVCSLIEGAGFGMAWTFILRRVTGLADASEVQRISGALPTIQRLGYALGAAYVGIVANASGFTLMRTSAEAADVAKMIYLGSLPFALVALVAMWGLVRDKAAVPALESTLP